MTILDTIVRHKWAEIAAAKAAAPEADLERRAAGMPPARDFSGALTKPGMRLIAEVKKASPSAGVIRTDFDPVTIARTYERHGADCVSVLTDRQFFQGELSYLTVIRDAIRLPVLRKEFILDRYQLVEARAAGADAVLLIAEILPGDRLRALFDQATELGLHVLVELHDAEELPRVIDCGAMLIGINNRDLRTFRTTLDHTLGLLAKVPSDRVVVSESGIKTNADLKRLEAAGVKAVLVGESLMRAPDIGAALDELRGARPTSAG
ncbi:MAG TPA: indole-3-glycerol phosphate synthase TrpC [Gemmataceae bacterium]|nr:indole-3-glycerol phosphate synthase TrpC [Gemmataceae bacterium]